MSEKLAHAEFSRRGGLSKSARKTEAVRRNLMKAKSVLRAKRANAKKASAENGLLSPGAAGRLSAP